MLSVLAWYVFCQLYYIFFMIQSKMIIPAEPAAYKKNGELYLRANNSYTPVAQAVKVS